MYKTILMTYQNCFICRNTYIALQLSNLEDQNVMYQLQ